MNGYLFPKEDIRILSQIVMQVISKGKVSSLARNMASVGRGTAKNLMALESIEGYALLLENVFRLPSEVEPPKDVTEIPLNLKDKWQWNLFEAVSNLTYFNTTLRSSTFLDNLEQWNHTRQRRFDDITASNDSFIYSIWEEEKHIEIANSRKRREEEEVMELVGRYYMFPKGY